MPLVENYRIPEIRADIARIKERIANPGQIPSGFMHVNAKQAMDAQATARIAALQRLQRELVDAMLNSGAWTPGAVLESMGER
jgi:hypothetical protein